MYQVHRTKRVDGNLRLHGDIRGPRVGCKAAPAREDAGMPGSLGVCAVCHRTKAPGSWSADGGVFVCVDCQVDARHFLEIQDQIDDERRRAGHDGGAEPVVDPSA